MKETANRQSIMPFVTKRATTSSTRSLEKSQTNLLLVPDKRGRLPIHLAVQMWRRKDAEKEIELLIQKSPESVSLGRSNSSQPPPFHFALLSSIRLFFNLIKAIDRHSPSSVQLCDQQRKLSLHTALEHPRKPSSETVEFLLRIYPEALQKSDVNGRLPLHIGFMNNRPCRELAKLIDVYPASLRYIDKEGNLPLDYALLKRGMPANNLLMNRDPDTLLLCNEYQMNALVKACQMNSKLDILFSLVRNNPINVICPCPEPRAAMEQA